METNCKAVPEVPPTNVPYLIVCSIVAVLLFGLLLVYRLQFYDSPAIIAILALLLLNQFLMLLLQVPGYFSGLPNWGCIVSITGTTFFRLAAYYWLIFVTRLVYHQKAAPGRFIDLSKYISRNVIFTYIPSVIVTLLVLIVANIVDTTSQSYCWRIISEKTVTDYIIYLSCFVLPTLAALIGVIIYFFAVLAVKKKSSNSLCLYFPISAVPFMCYDLVLKMMTFFGEWTSEELLDVPLVCQPLAHGIIFFFVLKNLAEGRRPTSSDLTIKEQTDKIQSFVLPPEDQG